MSRPENLVGETHKLKIWFPDGTDLTFYMTVNRTLEGAPYEVFVNVKHAEYWEHLTVVCVLISRLLQAKVSAKTIAEDLLAIRSPFTAHFVKGRPEMCTSVYARIGEILSKYT